MCEADLLTTPGLMEPTVEVPPEYQIVGAQVRKMRKKAVKEADIINIWSIYVGKDNLCIK